MNPLDYLKSLTVDTSGDLVYKYEGGQINFRTYFTGADAELLPDIWFKGIRFQMSLVLFRMMARHPNGLPMFPMQPGIEHEKRNMEVFEEFLSLNAQAMFRIVEKVGLLDIVLAQMERYPEIDGEEPEDTDDPKSETMSSDQPSSTPT